MNELRRAAADPRASRWQRNHPLRRRSRRTMLKLTDLRKTTRRVVKDDDLRVVYPRFLRDRSLGPRIELATRYLEKMVGHARRELDQEVVAQLFGDHKLARCIIACLAASYRYRARSFGEVVAPELVAKLAAQG